MKVVSIAAAKGGVGKTATAVNLAHLAAESGVSTLLWDLDPQGAASHCYRIEAKVTGGANRLLSGKRDLRFHVRQVSENLDVMPADPSFRVAESVLAHRRSSDKALRKLLRPLRDSYDVVILDCAPGLGLVTESVLAASDLVLSPVIPAPLSVRSLDQLTEFVDARHPKVEVMAFLSMLDDRKVLHRQVIEQVKDLAKSSIIQRAWATRGGPHLHGWVYRLDDGLIHPLCEIEAGSELDPIYRFNM